MTTIINTPAPTDGSNNMMGTIITLIVLLVVGYLFFIYGLPAIQRMGSPEINVPSEIDVNINQDGN